MAAVAGAAAPAGPPAAGGAAHPDAAPGGVGEAMARVSDDLWAQGVLEFLRGKQQGRCAQGLPTFEASVEADPSDGPRQLFVATLRALHRRTAEAEESYEAAIAAAPACKDAYLELALFLEAQGRRDAALEVARRAVAAGAYWADPWQRPPMFFPGLRSKPWWPREDFPWAETLEASWRDIKREMLRLCSVAKSEDMPGTWPKVGEERATQDGDIIAPGGEWREYVLFGVGPGGDAAQDAPRTCALLEELLPGAVAMAKIGAGEIIFSALAPGTRLVPHCASSNTRLTCHLGLSCPSGPRLRVGPEWGAWEEGKCLFFDDSFEHEVEHPGTAPRVVLLIRFWHPDLPEERWLPTLEAGMEEFNALQQRRAWPPLSPAVEAALGAASRPRPGGGGGGEAANAAPGAAGAAAAAGLLRADAEAFAPGAPGPGGAVGAGAAGLDAAIAADGDLF